MTAGSCETRLPEKKNHLNIKEDTNYEEDLSS